MSQAPTDGKSLLDPFGVWKAARDANLEAWSKLMIDIVNSDEYSRATGAALEQILATSQPLRDNMERSMTQTLSMLNMPSRAEVISLAERLVNVEMLLDDLDAKITAGQKSLQETIKKTVQEAITTQNSRLKAIETQVDPKALQSTVKEAVGGAFAAQSTQLKSIKTELETAVKETVRVAMTTQNTQLKSVDTQLQAVKTMLSDLKVATRASAQPRAEAKVEAKPVHKPAAAASNGTPARPTAKADDKPVQPTAKVGSSVKEQEAK